jgi:hypothetical protein
MLLIKLFYYVLSNYDNAQNTFLGKSNGIASLRSYVISKVSTLKYWMVRLSSMKKDI